METKFAIVTIGRTGSSFLCDLLNSHSMIDCQYEIFKDVPQSSNTMDYVHSKLQDSKNNVAGFKLLHFQADLELHKSILADSDIKIIFLRRRNPIDRFVSLKLAEHNGVYHLDHQLTPEVVDRGIKDILMLKYTVKEVRDKISHTIKSLIEKLTYKPHQLTILKDASLKSYEDEKNYHRMVNQFASNKDSHFKEIFYEDLCTDNKIENHREILKYLGLNYEELTASRSKIDHHLLKERIENFDELKSALQGSELEEFV
jgi:hypothetical protein